MNNVSINSVYLRPFQVRLVMKILTDRFRDEITYQNMVNGQLLGLDWTVQPKTEQNLSPHPII